MISHILTKRNILYSHVFKLLYIVFVFYTQNYHTIFKIIYTFFSRKAKSSSINLIIHFGTWSSRKSVIICLCKFCLTFTQHILRKVLGLPKNRIKFRLSFTFTTFRVGKITKVASTGSRLHAGYKETYTDMIMSSYSDSNTRDYVGSYMSISSVFHQQKFCFCPKVYQQVICYYCLLSKLLHMLLVV